jgi:hypothetical protein
MGGATDQQRRAAAISRSLKLVIEAMDLLDAHDGPPEAAAHLELARQRLQDAMRG